MKIHLYFGDYWGDGHGKSYLQVIEAPSEEHVRLTRKKVEEQYPHFFSTFAYDYEDCSIGPEVEQALLDTNYPMERFLDTNDDIGFEGFDSLEEFFNSDLWIKKYERQIFTIEFVADAIIWVLNHFGAEITPIDNDIPIIQITSGYGLLE